MLSAFYLAIGMLCIYLEINTNYMYPCRGLIYPWWGLKVPVSGTSTPPGGLVRSFHDMQLFLIKLEGLVDGLLSVNPIPQVTTCIIGQLIP